MVPWIFFACVLAHPFHTTTAEMEWNRDSGRWEVSLKMQGFDAQRAFQSQNQASPSLDRANKETIKQVFSKYLSTRFKLENARKESSEFHWIGMEEQGASLWFYFELTPPQDTTDLKLFQTVLHEFETDQVNTVTVRSDRPRSINLTRKSPSIALSALQPSVKK